MKTFVFDLDGTMYRGNAIIESAKSFLDICYEKRIPYLFLTNNSMRTPEENTKHMLDMGYEHIKPSMFYNSAMASCQYVKKISKQRKAYYIGQNGIRSALEEEGFEITNENPDFVFVGLDKQGTYDAYSKALTHLLHGAKLIGTNKDRVLAKPDGFEIGNGSIVAMLEYASEQESPAIAKPNRAMLDLFLDYFHLKKDDIILVGDNLETDIRLGFENDVKTIFVQTGVHSKDDIERFKIYPDYCFDSMMDFEMLNLLY